MKKGTSVPLLCRRGYLRMLHDVHVAHGGQHVAAPGRLKASVASRLQGEETFGIAALMHQVCPQALPAPMGPEGADAAAAVGGVVPPPPEVHPVAVERRESRRGLNPLLLFMNTRLAALRRLQTTPLSDAEMDAARLLWCKHYMKSWATF